MSAIGRKRTMHVRSSPGYYRLSVETSTVLAVPDLGAGIPIVGAFPDFHPRLMATWRLGDSIAALVFLRVRSTAPGRRD